MSMINVSQCLWPPSDYTEKQNPILAFLSNFHPPHKQSSNNRQNANQLAQSRKPRRNPSIHKRPGPEQDCKQIIHKAPAEIELDPPHRILADFDHRQDANKARAHEHDVCGGSSYIATGLLVHVYADCGAREGNGIVCAVADEYCCWVLHVSGTKGWSDKVLDVGLLVCWAAPRAHVLSCKAELS